jgi:hypothetical protein
MLLAAMADAVPDLDALTTLAESGKTISMVLNARKSAKSLILNALRGGKETAKAAGTAWLQWRYGWQQLYYDIAAAREALKYPIRRFVDGQVGNTVITTDSGEDTVPTSVHCEFVQAWSRTTDLSARARFVGRLRAETVNALLDVPTTGWELIPFSWVADWFISIGDVLRAWKVKRSCDAVAASIGWKITTKSSLLAEAQGIDGYSATGSAFGSETLSGRGRIPAGIPELVPSVTVHLTGKRILDAAALLSQRIL